MRASSGERTDLGLTLALGATFVVLLGFWVQSLRSVRAHEALVDETLGDYAAFAAERLASELDGIFAALFLEEIAVAREAHYSWRTLGSAEPLRSPRGLPNDAISAVFTLTDSTLVTHGPFDPAVLEWAESVVRRHEPGFPRPAPYAVLRARDRHPVVYRKEVDYERGEGAIYGFVVDLTRVRPWLDYPLANTPLLPRSLDVEADEERLLRASVHLHPDDEALARFGRDDARGPHAWAFAGKAARLAVGVTIDEEDATPLLVGGASATLRSLGVLGALTLVLLLVSVRLHRRAARLVALRDQFVANISHDLRTPITQLRMFSEMLESGRLTDEADRQRALQVIHRQSELLSDLVSNIVLAGASRPDLAPADTELEPLVADVVQAYEPLASEKGATLRVHWSPRRTGRVDPMAFRRILTNLVDNALRHAEGALEIGLRIDSDDDSVTLVVEDDGVGISEGERERVFERFERLDADGEQTGTGLGLSVVRDLAHRHDGDAWVESAEPTGARVVVRLGSG